MSCAMIGHALRLFRYDHDATCFIADIPAVAECVRACISIALSHSRPIRAEIDWQTASRGIHWGTGGYHIDQTNCSGTHASHLFGPALLQHSVGGGLADGAG